MWTDSLGYYVDTVSLQEKEADHTYSSKTRDGQSGKANESKVEPMTSSCSYGNTDKTETVWFDAFCKAHVLHICSGHFEMFMTMICQWL